MTYFLLKVFSYTLLILLNIHIYKFCFLTSRIIHMNRFSLYSLPCIPVIPFLMRWIRLSGTFIGILWDTEVYAHIFQGETQFLRVLFPSCWTKKSLWNLKTKEVLNRLSVTSCRYSSTRRQSFPQTTLSCLGIDPCKCVSLLEVTACRNNLCVLLSTFY